MTIEYKVIKDESKAGKVDKNGAPLECYTFTVNGMPSMKWFKPCLVEGLPEDYYVQRCIGRLKQGRSREAFGGPLLAQTSGGVVKHIGNQAARGSVTRCERRRRWVYTLDGMECKEDFPTEGLAKEACAVAAFMSRGKLGRFKEAEEEFYKTHGKKCQISVEGRGIVAHSECGARFSVGLVPGELARFKKLDTPQTGE